MIQDIAPHHFNNQFENRKVTDGDFIIILQNDHILLEKYNDHYQFPRYSDLKHDPQDQPVFLFKIDEQAYYSLMEVPEKPLFSYPVSQIRQLEDPVLAMAAITAVQLIRWRKSRKYCSVCGSLMEDSSLERARICPQCHHVEYPVISPCIIVAVIDRSREKILIVRSYSNTVKYALVAGYVEIGETLEEAVYREVKEETGIDIENLKYYGSQPWAFSSTQMMAFTADLKGDPALQIQTSEIREAFWASPQDLDEMKDPVSIGHTMIEAFRCHQLK